MRNDQREPGLTPQRVSRYLFLAFVLLLALVLRPLDLQHLWAAELHNAVLDLEQGSRLNDQARFPQPAEVALGHAALLPLALLNLLAPERGHAALLLAGAGLLALACGLLLAAAALPLKRRAAALPAGLLALLATAAPRDALFCPLPQFGLAALAAGGLLYLLSKTDERSGQAAWFNLGLLAGLSLAAGTWAAVLLLLPLERAWFRPRALQRIGTTLAGFALAALPALLWYAAYLHSWTPPESKQLSRTIADLGPWLPATLVSLAGLLVDARQHPRRSATLAAALALLILSGKSGRLADAAGAAAPLCLIASAGLFSRLRGVWPALVALAAICAGLALNIEPTRWAGLLVRDYSIDPLSGLALLPIALIAAAAFLIWLPRGLAMDRPRARARSLSLALLSLLTLICLSCLASY